MKKMSKEAQMQANGGATYYAWCIACGEQFEASSVKKVQSKGVAHCNAYGGWYYGHRYRMGKRPF